jgi:hypothetical protein
MLSSLPDRREASARWRPAFPRAGVQRTVATRRAATARPGPLRRWWIGLPDADKGILTAAAFVLTVLTAVVAVLVFRAA